MRRYLIALSMLFAAASGVSAQSFLDHLQKEGKEQGQGSVSVKQSDDISKLVNGKDKSKEGATANPKPEQRPATQQSQRPSTTTPPAQSQSSEAKTADSKKSTAPSTQSVSDRERERARQRREDAKLKEEARKEAQNYRDAYSSTATTSSQGSIRKVMRGGRRMDGYMVQVWAGGNTREDKHKAEQVGNEIKSKMPSQPVYVHFYSPRWACRIGNFKKQDDATSLVKQLKKMGYKSACVVKASLIVKPTK